MFTYVSLHDPVLPTASPLSLMLYAHPTESPLGICNSCTVLSSDDQITGEKPRVCGALHDGSGVLLSATPTIWPRSFTPKPKALLPPNVGNWVRLPLRHIPATQIRCVPNPQKSLPYGSGRAISETIGTSSEPLGFWA